MRQSANEEARTTSDERRRTGFTIREAGQDDLDMIVHQRRSMFRDMGEGTVDQLDRMAQVARPWLAQALADGTYRHWLAMDAAGHVAGGGGVLRCPWPPNPFDPSTERAVILNVYTEAPFRRHGVARQIMKVILEWIQNLGLQAANLHASNEGRALYESLGFTPTNEMRLRFDGSRASRTPAAPSAPPAETLTAETCQSKMSSSSNPKAKFR